MRRETWEMSELGNCCGKEALVRETWADRVRKGGQAGKVGTWSSATGGGEGRTNWRRLGSCDLERAI